MNNTSDIEAPSTAICGFRTLAEYLTKKGYPIKEPYLRKLSQRGKGPPVSGKWAGSFTFDPTAALIWADVRWRG